MLKKFTYIIFILLLLVLVGRSFQYIYRIYVEFRYPEPDKLSVIDVCQKNPKFSDAESEWLYKYLEIGKTCEKH